MSLEMSERRPVVIVTGGMQGIGRAIAEHFAMYSYDVAIGDVQKPSNEHPLPKGARYYPLDVRSEDSVNAMVANVALDFRGIDVLVNNAGITRDASLKKMTRENFAAVMDVNVEGPFLMAKAVAGYLKESGGGAIVNISSCNRNGAFGQSNYSASKAAIIGLTKSLAIELGRQKIRVNAVAPGFTKTEMAAAIPPEHAAQIKKMILLGNDFIPPESIAHAVYCAATIPHMTGAVIDVNGGSHM